MIEMVKDNIQMLNKIIHGDALEVLKTMPDNFIDCCVTSPPYFGLRDYGNDKQIGLEKSPEEYVSKLTEVFEQVRRVLVAPKGELCWTRFQGPGLLRCLLKS